MPRIARPTGESPSSPRPSDGKSSNAGSRRSASERLAAQRKPKPAAPRPGAKRPAGKRPPKSAGSYIDNVVNTRWTESRQFSEAIAAKGFFRQETLEKAVERLLTERDPVLQPAVQHLLGDVPLASMHFDLAWENANRFLYLIKVMNRQGGYATLGWLVARNHQEFGVALRAGQDGLKLLRELAPGLVSEVIGRGFVFLPDRYGRKEFNRELPTYLVRWPAKAAAPLCVGNDAQLALAATPRPRLLGKADTAGLRRSILELLLRAYQPEKGIGPNLQAISADDFIAWRDPVEGMRTLAAFWRARDNHITAGRYLQRILGMTWPAPGGGAFPIAPESPEECVEVVYRVLGRETGRKWIADCCSGRVSGDHGPSRGYIAALLDGIKD